jgi:hypothetical protein
MYVSVELSLIGEIFFDAWVIGDNERVEKSRARSNLLVHAILESASWYGVIPLDRIRNSASRIFTSRKMQKLYHEYFLQNLSLVKPEFRKLLFVEKKS